MYCKYLLVVGWRSLTHLPLPVIEEKKREEPTLDSKGKNSFCKHTSFVIVTILYFFSSERDLCSAELVTTREPCRECLKLIRAKNIAKIIWPLRDTNVGVARDA